MRLKHSLKVLYLSLFSTFMIAGNACAHDPVFSPGPHVLFKDGIEVHAEFTQGEQGKTSKNERSIALKYGLSGDWVVGVELPYETNANAFGSESGVGDATLSTKYRFWRNDSLGVQETAAIIAKVNLNTGNARISSNTTDALLGFTYGYESLTWYRWASVRYRFNQNSSKIDAFSQDQSVMQRGDRVFVDLAGGYRPQVNDYREADTVWLLELNGEYSEASAVNGVNINSSGGSQWFVSPGLMWTLRNFAIKSGIQVPIISNLNGDQARSDYRARLEFEWHL